VELEAAVFLRGAAFAIVRRLGRRGHAAVRGNGGGERDEHVGRDGEQPPGEAQRRGDVALERVREH